MIVDVELLYRQHLSEADRRLLAGVVDPGAPLTSALGDPSVEAVVFGSNGSGPASSEALFSAPEGGQGRRGVEELAATSPFLTFAVAVHRTAAYLETATFVEERWAPRQRIPVFDVAPLREFLADAVRRLFLVELLASYTHVTSGATWERTRRGWRRRRFSELDPVRLAELLETVDPAERAGIYRRLGDLALFLTGVFPDHRSLVDMSPVAAGRLRRMSGLNPGDDETMGPELLAALGPRWYAAAARTAQRHGAPVTGALAVVGQVAQRFGDARRVLNVVTDRFLFPLRERWFGLS